MLQGLEDTGGVFLHRGHCVAGSVFCALLSPPPPPWTPRLWQAVLIFPSAVGGGGVVGGDAKLSDSLSSMSICTFRIVFCDQSVLHRVSRSEGKGV